MILLASGVEEEGVAGEVDGGSGGKGEEVGLSESGEVNEGGALAEGVDFVGGAPEAAVDGFGSEEGEGVFDVELGSVFGVFGAGPIFIE